MREFTGKVAVITGGSKGIGLVTAELLAKQGARVIIVSRSQKNLDIAKNIIVGDVLAIQADISKLTDLDQLFLEVEQKYGNIDILFVNAGVTERAWLGQVTEEIFDKVVNVNYKGTFFTVQKALKLMKEGASIIMNASIAGMIAFDHHSVYSSSKAAVIHLAKTFAADLASRGIRVNTISPGYIRTKVWDPLINSPVFQSICNEVPFQKRLGSAAEIAQVVLFLASEDASYITGHNIPIDGGLTSLFMRYDKK